MTALLNYLVYGYLYNLCNRFENHDNGPNFANDFKKFNLKSLENLHMD